MFDFLRKLMGDSAPAPIPDELWNPVFAGIVWFDDLSPEERTRLREYAGRFLASKKFMGAGLRLYYWPTDDVSGSTRRSS